MILLVISTQFDVYAQIILDPQYTKTTFCIYQEAPLFGLYFNTAWGFVVWIALLTLHPPIYAACFIHRHQIIVPSESLFKLNSRARFGFLFMLTVVSVCYSYTYYAAWEPEAKWLVQKRMTPDWDPRVISRMECLPGATILRVSYTTLLFVACLIFVATISLHTFSILRHARNISPKTRSFHRIMMRSLLAVAAVPVVLIILPFALVLLYYYYWMELDVRITNLPLMDICTVINAFHAVTHSIVLILTTPVFRKRLLEIICIRSESRVVVSPKTLQDTRHFSIT